MNQINRSVSVARATALALVCSALFAASAFAANPTPTVNWPLSPAQSKAGVALGVTLTINGTGFVSGATVLWNGSARTTTFVTSSQVTAAISKADLATASTASVVVQNPAPGGGNSNAVFFQIGTQAPPNMARLDIVTGSGPEASSPGDFNGDGKMDLVVLNSPDNTMTYLQGNGDGTFQAGVNYPVPGFPVALTCADFNHDGKMDIVIVDQRLNAISVLLGNGDGTFQTHVEYSVGSSPYSAVFADFNGDGNLDLVIANRGSNNVSILLGNGDGTFQTQATYGTNLSPQAVTIGDFNRDGKLDLATANNGSDNVSILLGNGDGTFQTKVDYATAAGPTYVVTGDYNKDGKLDLVVSTVASFASILLGNGNGAFGTFTNNATGANSQIINLGDFNDDGKLDMVTADFSDNTLSILTGNADGTFATRIAIPVGLNPDWIGTGDVNNDGKLDLVTANSSTNTVSVLTGTAVTVSPSVVSFGTITAGTSGTPKAVTIKNTGTTTATLGTVSISGPNSNQWTATSSCPATLAAGASCTINATFSPTLSGNFVGAVNIGLGTNGQTVGAFIKGTGNIPIVLTPRTLTFATTALGATSAPSVFNFTNNSGVPITFSSIVLSGINQSDFAYTTDCPLAPATLGAFTTCHVNVTFTPSATGNRTVTLIYTGSFTLAVQGSLLNGVGTALSFSASSLNFGTVALGGSAALPLVVTNVSSSPITFSGVSKSGTNAADYGQTNNCIGTLAGFGTCTVTLTFQPLGTGTRTATLKLNDADPGSPQSFTLTGVGQ